jgi:hypothetical protein
MPFSAFRLAQRAFAASLIAFPHESLRFFRRPPVAPLKKRKRGRPAAGLRPSERTTDYRRLTLRIPARIHHQLERLARDERLPQWRIVVAALQQYDTKTHPRHPVQPFS